MNFVKTILKQHEVKYERPRSICAGNSLHIQPKNLRSEGHRTSQVPEAHGGDNVTGEYLRHHIATLLREKVH